MTGKWTSDQIVNINERNEHEARYVRSQTELLVASTVQSGATKVQV